MMENVGGKRILRPLWMTEHGIESYAEMLGGGGDAWSDWVWKERPLWQGEEESE